MQAVLVMFRSDGERRSFSITRDVTVIGRREDCDLRIPVHDVSRKHARLIRDGDQLRLEDLGSSNGTYLNGQRIERDADVQAGDSVQVGPVVFVLQVDGWPADEELNPITAESVAQAALFAAPGEMPSAPGAYGDELEPLSEDDLGDLAEAPPAEGGFEDDLQPIDELQPTDELEPAEGGYAQELPAEEPEALDDLDDLDGLEPIELTDEDAEPAAPVPPPPPATMVRPPPRPVAPPPPPAAPIPLADDDDLIPLSDEEPLSDDQPLEMAEDIAMEDAPADDGLIPLDDETPLEPISDEDVLIDMAPEEEPEKGR